MFVRHFQRSLAVIMTKTSTYSVMNTPMVPTISINTLDTEITRQVMFVSYIFLNEWGLEIISLQGFQTSCDTNQPVKSQDDQKLEISDLRRRGIVLSV